MKKQFLTVLSVMVLFGLLLVACQPAVDAGEPSEPEAPVEEPSQPEPAEPEPAEPEPTPEPTEEPEGATDVLFDPITGGSAETTGLVYEGLVKLDGDTAVPQLALSATVSDDGLDYIVSLRPGVTFHDGSALNADTVVANFDRWYDPANGVEAWATNFGGFKGETDGEGKPKCKYDGIEKVDELTVLVHLNEPDAQFLNKLTDPAFGIVSATALSSSYFGSEAGGDGGSGPYKIGAWSDTGLTLEPFADYWNPDAVPESGMDISF